MKKILTLICTLLCANVLLAQDVFLAGQLYYSFNSNSSVKVYGYNSSNPPTNLVIPETVTYQGTTFNVTEIDELAFYYYYNGDWVQSPCTTLTSVTIPNSVTSIGEMAFVNCTSLTSITIPNSVTSIGGAVFSGCSSLTSVTLSNNITELPSLDIEGYWYGFFDGCSSLTSITIPNSVTSIGSFAFIDCSSLTSVTIPNSVTSIGDDAFGWCSSLISIDIPNSVTSIGSSAFNGCSSLTSVTIPNSVTEIGNSAFYNCSSLTSVTIPNSVTSIGDAVFGGCNITSITIPNSVTSIGMWAFCWCSSLTSVDIPNSVTSIGERAFWNCSSLTSVTIGNGVTSIGDEAFINCSSLTSVTCLRSNSPSLGSDVFYGTPSNKTLTVPCGSVEAYCSSSAWNSFSDSNIQGVEFNIETNVNNINYGSVAVENNCSTATLTANPTICSQFVSWNDGNTDNPRTINLVSDTSFTALFEEIEFNTELSATICEGSVYTENNFNVSEAGVYTQNLTSVNGCDSIVTLTLNVNPIFNTELSATICEGQVYTENNFNVSEAGIYTQTLQTVNGCDSIVTLTLNVNPVFNTPLTATICEGSVYNENGFNVSEAGTYTQSLQSVNGCDSIVTLTLNVTPSYHTNLTATICEGSAYTENGFNVSEAGVYTLNLQTVNGCDSVVTLNLNVNPVYNTDLFASICEGEVYNENGFNVSEAGVYSHTLQAVNGCDSVVNLTLSVNPIFNTNLSAFICEGETYAENGFNVSEAGVYTQTLQTVHGCDSIVTLTLNVNPVFNTPLTATICEGSVYNENGFNVSEAGTYTQSLQSVNGCDSIVTLTLNVTPSYHTNLTATICEGSELNISGFNVSEAGVYTQSFTAVNGCDSIVTLTVTALPVYNTNLTLTICEGTSMNFCGFNVTEGGVYTQTFTAVNGCDSVVTLTVTELPIIHTDLTLSICEGTTLNFSGFNVSEAGSYTQTHTAANGCDSIVTLVVTTYPSFDTTINATINAGETYAEFGFNESEAGTYVQNLQTVNGCDSTITLILDVNSSLMDVEHSELSFYPNPTDSKITFSSTIESIEVIDLTGRCVLTFTNVRTINIESLPSGAYYLRLTNDEKTIMQKVIKQ